MGDRKGRPYANPVLQEVFMSRILDTQSYLDAVCDLLREGHTHGDANVGVTFCARATPTLASPWRAPA